MLACWNFLLNFKKYEKIDAYCFVISIVRYIEMYISVQNGDVISIS